MWETAGVPEVQAVGGLVFRTCLLTLLPPLLQLNGGGLGLCLVLLFCHSGAVLLTYLIAQIPRLGQYRFLSQASRVGPGKLSFQYTSTVYFVKHSMMLKKLLETSYQKCLIVILLMIKNL